MATAVIPVSAVRRAPAGRRAAAAPNGGGASSDEGLQFPLPPQRIASSRAPAGRRAAAAPNGGGASSDEGLQFPLPPQRIASIQRHSASSAARNVLDGPAAPSYPAASAAPYPPGAGIQRHSASSAARNVLDGPAAPSYPAASAAPYPPGRAGLAASQSTNSRRTVGWPAVHRRCTLSADRIRESAPDWPPASRRTAGELLVGQPCTAGARCRPTGSADMLRGLHPDDALTPNGVAARSAGRSACDGEGNPEPTCSAACTPTTRSLRMASRHVPPGARRATAKEIH